MTRQGYIDVDDLRREGVANRYSDELLESRIEIASILIDEYTGRFFEPRSMVVQLNGYDSHIQPVGDPIITIDQVQIITGHPSQPIYITNFADDELVVYNRHLRMGLLNPDDRENPRIEIEQVRSLHYSTLYKFPYGSQNVILTGIFGYTDPASGFVISGIAEPFPIEMGGTLILSIDGGDPQTITFPEIIGPTIEITAASVAATINSVLVGGKAVKIADGFVKIVSLTKTWSSSVEILGGTLASIFLFPTGIHGFPYGITPPLIKRAAMLMVIRDLPPLANDEERDDVIGAYKVSEMKTVDQFIRWRNLTKGAENDHQFVGSFTGDPEIDKIIGMYVRPPEIAVVGGRPKNSDPLVGRESLWWPY
jgi:hypothetical protein